MPALFFHLVLSFAPPFIFPHYIYLNLLFEASVISWGFQASRGWRKGQEPFGFRWQPMVAIALSPWQGHQGHLGPMWKDFPGTRLLPKDVKEKSASPHARPPSHLKDAKKKKVNEKPTCKGSTGCTWEVFPAKSTVSQETPLL